MSLSTSNIYTIFYDNLHDMYKDDTHSKIEFYFLVHLPQIYFTSISKLTKNWHGIDAKSTIILIVIAELILKKEKEIRNISFFPSEINKVIMKKIYNDILNVFHECCAKFGIKFDKPSFKALETILEKKAKN